MNTLLVYPAASAEPSLLMYMEENGFSVLERPDCSVPKKADAALCLCGGADPGMPTDIPVLALTDRKEDTVRLLDGGAADVMVRPADRRELVSRLRALIRRAAITNRQDCCAGSLHANPYSRTVCVEGRSFNLPRREYKLLQALISRPGHIFSRGELMSDVWGEDCESGERTVDVHIKRIREKLTNVSDKWELATVWSVGYKFETKG